MVVSIPTCAAWTGEASHLLFSSYEALEDGGAAAAEETRWARGRARAFRALGLDGAVQRCAADLGLIFLAWVLVGSLFYKYDAPADPWNDGYAVYYSPKPRPSRDAGRERNTDACGRREHRPEPGLGAAAPDERARGRGGKGVIQVRFNMSVDRFGKSIHASRTLREMIARPKMSRNEWNMTEI